MMNFSRSFIGNHFGGVELLDEAIHTTADGRRLLILHGDKFDCVTKYHKWLVLLGDWSYTVLLAINRWLAVLRRLFGFGYWSLSAFLKH